MKLATFKKGIHPEDTKHYTNSKHIEVLPAPEEVFVPLQQHTGASCNPKVEVGQEVKTGQIIAESEAFVSSPVHASITGKVKAIDSFLHPLGSRIQMIHIQRTGDDEWQRLSTNDNWELLSSECLRNLIYAAGVVGLGGAAFPTHVKLAPPKDKPIDTFILNGCECEPYLTADHRAMVEQTDKVLLGMSIITKVLGVRKGVIGIENNKPDAIQRMNDRIKKLGYSFRVFPLEVKYPQGAEKMLIEAILHRRVPAGGLPLDVGVVVNNVGTALAVAEAVSEGKPLIQRIVTVTGDGIHEPKNVLVRIGTRFKEVLNFCGGLKEEATQVFMGGPMMGFAQYNLDVPVVKATSGIICTNDAAIAELSHFPCIRCGACISACPVNLLPTRLARYSEIGEWEQAEKWGIFNCMECGSCAFVCPSHIPLVQWIRVGKLRINEMNHKNAA